MLRSAVVLLVVVAVAAAWLKPSEVDGEIDGKTEERFMGRHLGRAGRGHLGHHGRGRHHHHPLPPFLRNVTSEARREYFHIVFDRNATKAEIKEHVKEWAVKYHQEEGVKEFYTKLKEFFEGYKKNETEAIAKLPEAWKAVSVVFADESLTHRQTWEKVHKLMEGYSFELRALLWGARPRFHHPREGMDGRERSGPHGFSGKFGHGFGPKMPSPPSIDGKIENGESNSAETEDPPSTDM